MRGGRGRGGVALLLVAILLAGGWLRGRGLLWDEGTYLHPDERFLAFVESSVALPDSLQAYLDTTRSPLNPNNRGHGFFVYGQLPVTLVRLLGETLGAEGVTIDERLVGRDLGPYYENVALLGRALSAASDLATVLVTFLIGRTLYGTGVGVLAAALYAVAVTPIQQAHFFTVDAIATLFVALALWLAARAAQGARWSDDVWFGLALGAGLATKVSIVPVALLLGLALVVRVTRPPSTGAAGDASPARAVLSLCVAAIVALLAFRLLHPYAFVPTYAGYDRPPRTSAVTHLLDRAVDVVTPAINPAWTRQMAEVGLMMSGAIDQPPNHQWATRTPLVFPWLTMVRYGLGWPLGLAAWAAWAWALVELARRAPGAARHLLPVAWVGGFFLWYGTRWVMKIGYFLPIYPALVVLAAWGLLALARGEAPLGRSTTPARRRFGIAATAVVLLGTIGWAAAFSRVYARPHPRLAASRWLYEHVPGDVTLELEDARGRFAVQVGLANEWPPPDGAADDAGAPRGPYARLDPQDPRAAPVYLARPGRLVGVRLHRVAGLSDAPSPAAVHVALADAETDRTLAACDISGPFAPLAAGGGTAACRVEPAPLAAATPYVLKLAADGGPVVLAGGIVAGEGEWDDALPVMLDPHDPWGSLYEGAALQTVLPDTPEKRARMLEVLARSDVVVLSSNRLFDSLRRNPRRWPLTVAFYRALFAGELGYDLVADFASMPSLGPWWVDDSGAEEAFTVYDHPRVFVFRKRLPYDPAPAAAALAGVDLDAVAALRADEVTDAPAVLPIPPPAGPTGSTAEPTSGP